MVAEGLGATVLPDFSVIGDPLERRGTITVRPLAGDATDVLRFGLIGPLWVLIGETPPLNWCAHAPVWLPGSMTVLVTRRHVDYVRVTTTGCSAVS